MERVRFGLVGFGAWGRCHAEAIARTPGAELVAVAARSEASCAAAREAHPTVQVHSDYRRILDLAELDVVDVVLPSHLHCTVGRDALASGKHLLLEKPMTLSVADCQALIELAQRTGRLLWVGHELRFSSLWGAVKELIDSGAIGQPQYVLVELSRRPYRQGADGWRYDIARVGNWILEEPIHFFDLARWYLSSVGLPQDVYATANSRQPGHPELEDNFSAIVRFESGAYAVITQTLAAFEHHQTVKVTGARGAIWATWSGAMDRTRQPSFRLRAFDGEELRDVPLSRGAGELFELEEEIAAMVRAVQPVRGGQTAQSGQTRNSACGATRTFRTGSPAARGEDGKWAVALCLAAAQSVRTGGVVSILGQDSFSPLAKSGRDLV